MKRMSWAKDFRLPKLRSNNQKSEEKFTFARSPLIRLGRADTLMITFAPETAHFFFLAKKKYYSRRYGVVNSIRK